MIKQCWQSVLGDEAKELPEAKRLTFPVNCSSEQVYSMLSQPIPIASRGMPAGHLIAVGPHQLHPGMRIYLGVPLLLRILAK